MSSHSSSPKQSSNGSAAEFIRGVQKLIDSDQDQQIQKKMKQLQNIFPILTKIYPFMTNGQKISLFIKDHNFRNKLNDLLKSKGIFNFNPVIKIQLYSIRYHSTFIDQFDNLVLQLIFIVKKKVAYIQYNDYVAAYTAIKCLNDFQLQGDILRISVKWCEQIQQVQIVQNLFLLSKRLENNINLNHIVHQSQKQIKFMCRYDIYLDAYPQFKTAQKIIGPKGSYMKKIIDKTVNGYGADISSIERLVKLRLRGKGSGFKQGPNGVQSDQRLHLCVSTKQQILYDNVCREAQLLLLKVSQDYKFHGQKLQKKPLQGLAYCKFQLKKGVYQQVKKLTLEQIDSTYELIIPVNSKKISETEIIQFINSRDKARKSGRYRQADQMRNQLKKRGVCLIDEKAGKGKSMKTTWKYIDQ